MLKFPVKYASIPHEIPLLFLVFSLRGVHPHKPMMQMGYSPYFQKNFKFTPYFRIINPHYFRSIDVFCLIYVLIGSPYFDHDAMHLCIMLYTYFDEP